LLKLHFSIVRIQVPVQSLPVPVLMICLLQTALRYRYLLSINGQR
jgi:hypothetical protein